MAYGVDGLKCFAEILSRENFGLKNKSTCKTKGKVFADSPR